MSKILYLIRHGISEWNKLGIIQGEKHNLWLSEEGISAVKKNSATFDKEIELIRCSCLKRAIETADIFATEKDIPIIVHEELKEFWAGILQGLSHMGAQERYPKEYEIRNKRGDLDGIDKAETGNELQARALFFLLEYKNKDSYKELIVSHAWFLRCLINTILFRDRTTPIDVAHNALHTIKENENKIEFVQYWLWANSEIYIVKTFEKTYLVKKTNKGSLQKSQMKKNITSYLNRDIIQVAPEIFFSWEKKEKDKTYVVEIMSFIKGDHLQEEKIVEKIELIMPFFYNLSDKLSQYFVENKEIKLQSLKDKILQGVSHIDIQLCDIEKIILFLEKNTLPQSIIYYDIHNQNILFTEEWMYILDMDSFLIWPKLFQLACVLMFLLYEWVRIDIDSYIDKWWEKTYMNEVRILMKVRCLIGIIFFSKKNKNIRSENDLFYLEKYIDIYNSIVID